MLYITQPCPVTGENLRVAKPAGLFGRVGPCEDSRIEQYITDAKDEAFDGVQLDFQVRCTVDELVLASLPDRLAEYGQVQFTPGTETLTLLFAKEAA